MPLNIDLQQIMLHLFNFVILFAGLYFILYAPVKKFIEKRQNEFKEADDKAKATLAESESIKAGYEAKVSGFEAELQEKRNQARAEAQEAADKRIAEAKAEAERIVAKAKEDAEHEKERIIASAQTDISNMVNEATEKLALKASASQEYDEFLNAAEGSNK